MRRWKSKLAGVIRFVGIEGVLTNLLPGSTRQGCKGRARCYHFNTLAGKGKVKADKKPRGLERKKMWEDVRALRKEWAFLAALCCSSD